MGKGKGGNGLGTSFKPSDLRLCYLDVTLKPHTVLCWHLVVGVPGCQGVPLTGFCWHHRGNCFWSNKNRNGDTEVKPLFSLSLNAIWINLKHFVQPKIKGSVWCQGVHFSCLTVAEESQLRVRTFQKLDCKIHHVPSHSTSQI